MFSYNFKNMSNTFRHFPRELQFAKSVETVELQENSHGNWPKFNELFNL